MADPKQVLRDRVANDHTYHRPVNDQAQRYEGIRAQARAFSEYLIDACPPGRELSTALTKVEEAVFHANAGIARSGEVAIEEPATDEA